MTGGVAEAAERIESAVADGALIGQVNAIGRHAECGELFGDKRAEVEIQRVVFYANVLVGFFADAFDQLMHVVFYFIAATFGARRDDCNAASQVDVKRASHVADESLGHFVHGTTPA